MNIINLTSHLQRYNSGWIAYNKKQNKVVAHSKTFDSIVKKTKLKRDILLVPATSNYLGFVT
jgi:hypothetical protein